MKNARKTEQKHSVRSVVDVHRNTLSGSPPSSYQGGQYKPFLVTASTEHDVSSGAVVNWSINGQWAYPRGDTRDVYEIDCTALDIWLVDGNAARTVQEQFPLDSRLSRAAAAALNIRHPKLGR